MVSPDSSAPDLMLDGSCGLFHSIVESDSSLLQTSKFNDEIIHPVPRVNCSARDKGLEWAFPEPGSEYDHSKIPSKGTSPLLAVTPKIDILEI